MIYSLIIVLLEKLQSTIKLSLYTFRTLQEAFAGLFPRNNPRDTRFAINFFTSIGLGGLTDDLREHLKVLSKVGYFVIFEYFEYIRNLI